MNKFERPKVSRSCGDQVNWLLAKRRVRERLILIRNVMNNDVNIGVLVGGYHEKTK